MIGPPREPLENLIRALDEAKRSKSKAKTFKDLFNNEVKGNLSDPSLRMRATHLTEKWDQTSANKLKKMVKELLGPEQVANKRGRQEEAPIQDLPVEKPGRTKSTKSKSVAMQQANANRIAHIEADALQPVEAPRAPLLEKWAPTNWTDAIPRPTIPTKGQVVKRTAIGLAVAASTFALNGYFKTNPTIGFAFTAASYTLGAYNVKQLFFDKKG